MGEISPRIVCVRSNTGETSGSSPLQRQNDALMAPNPRENSRGRTSRETSVRLAYEGKSPPRIASVRSNTGETTGGRSLQRQKYAWRAPNLRGNSRGGRTSRETSGKLAYVGESSPRIASARSNTRETYGSNLLQRQRETSIAPNPRENSRGGRTSREKYAGETSPTESEIPAEMAERLFMQESLYSLPGSVLSGPHDELVKEPLCQEDTCHRSEHTSHQK